ncbi:MAG: FtsH protease activity modulator HflK [Candidatus Omnitrophica bacterium]|nr:FtsH protease activity modulator HflK [Candidatus Omnitrophota bacterium]
MPDDWNIGDLERLEAARKKMTKMLPQTILGIAAVVVILWLLSGFYVVGPGEQAIIRQFGKETGTAVPGLHYCLPQPIQKATVVNLERVRRAEIGFRSFRRMEETFTQRIPAESLMLTGDANIVEAQMIVQYVVKDPSKYLFRLRDPDENLRACAEVALRSAAGNATIDEILTVGRAKVQDETTALLQKLLDEYQSGLRVTEVRLQVVDPPDQVKDAFHEVVRAREDLERLVNQARGYREDLLPKARGEAEKIIRAAEAYQQERVLRARGDADRFIALLTEYQKAPRVTRDRLYLESLNRILPKVQKVVISDRQGLMPLLSLPAAAGGDQSIPAALETLRTSSGKERSR